MASGGVVRGPGDPDLCRVQVGERIIAMREIEADGERQLMGDGERAGRPLLDRVRRTLFDAAASLICGACEHARAVHDREHDGGPCSVCDCRGFEGRGPDA